MIWFDIPLKHRVIFFKSKRNKINNLCDLLNEWHDEWLHGEYKGRWQRLCCDPDKCPLFHIIKEA